MGSSVNNTKATGTATPKTICLDGADRKVTSVNFSQSGSTAGNLAASATGFFYFDLGADYDQYESVILTLNTGVNSPSSTITEVWGGDSSAVLTYPLLNLLTNAIRAPIPVETISNQYAVGKFAVVSRYLTIKVTAGSAAWSGASMKACPDQ